MIEYINRYSDTDIPDKLGRWARIAKYKSIQIAWINRIEKNDEIVFIVNCSFPTLSSDISNERKICYDLDEAKSFIDERWFWFLQQVS